MRFIIAFLIIGFFSEIFAQQLYPHPKTYSCYQTVDSIMLDGFLNEKSWESAKWTDDFIDIEGESKPKPRHQTKVKMLWDSDNLYIAALLEEPHLWATLTERESIIYSDNDFEIFIDPTSDNHHYAEIEINAFGTEMDLLLTRPYREGVVPSFGWDCKGLKKGIRIIGTVNNPADTDSAWTVEMAIPLKSISDLIKRYTTPKDGDFWRINFSRVQWDLEVVDGKYKKLKKPEHNWVWSPQWAINMHMPEFWGYVNFIEKDVNLNNNLSFVDELWDEKMHLMSIYEAQKSYYKIHNKYTSAFSDLVLPKRIKSSGISIEATSKQFTAWLNKNDKTLFVNDKGKLWQEK